MEVRREERSRRGSSSSRAKKAKKAKRAKKAHESAFVDVLPPGFSLDGTDGVVGRGKNGSSRKKSIGVTGAEKAPVVEADFLPPGFSLDTQGVSGAPQTDGDQVTTYFLYTEKRGLSRYLPRALKAYRKGFRAVVLAKEPIVFDRPNARVVGKKSGDYFEAAQSWVERNILTELHRRYIASGGGTMRERERTENRFYRALEKVEELREKVRRADRELEQASMEMVLRFGKKSYVMRGTNVVFDACCGPGDKVYWRGRSKPSELGE